MQVFTRVGAFLSEWGTPGSGDGQFNAPFGLALGPSGYVYVTGAHVGDHSSGAHGRATHRVQVFSADGTFVTKWGTLGSDDGQFSSPFGIAVDPSGTIYVADHANDRIQVFQ